MMIHDVTALAGRFKKRKRVGRGEGSGHGKQSGRGNKGQSSRSGYAGKRSFEGGQMPFFRRMAKFGFTNAYFKTQFWIVNLADILKHPNFTKGGTVNAESLIAAGLVRDTSRDLKILGSVTEEGVKVKLTVEANRVSDGAKKLIEGAGGSVQQTGTRRDRTRGIDRNSDDRTPKNWTKRLDRGGKGGSKAKPAAEESESAEPAKKKGAKPEGKKADAKPQGKPEAQG